IAFGEVEHPHHISDLVLTVSVEGDDVPRSGLLEHIAETGLQCGPLTEVDGMPQYARAGGRRDISTAVGTSVIDADDVLEMLAQLGDNVGDHRGFVEEWNYDPRVGCVPSR